MTGFNTIRDIQVVDTCPTPPLVGPPTRRTPGPGAWGRAGRQRVDAQRLLQLHHPPVLRRPRAAPLRRPPGPGRGGQGGGYGATPAVKTLPPIHPLSDSGQPSPRRKELFRDFFRQGRGVDSPPPSASPPCGHPRDNSVRRFHICIALESHSSEYSPKCHPKAPPPPGADAIVAHRRLAARPPPKGRRWSGPARSGATPPPPPRASPRGPAPPTAAPPCPLPPSPAPGAPSGPDPGRPADRNAGRSGVQKFPEFSFVKL